MVVFDSSFLVAFYNALDTHHEAARVTMEEVTLGKWGEPAITTDVFSETVTVIMVRNNLEAAITVAQELNNAAELQWVSTEHAFQETLRLFCTQNASKKPLSFVDASLANLVRNKPDAVLATFDQGFSNVPDIRTIP